ncbi:DUF4287 domain-containing protein [Micromonospora sp. RTP1Z1]|uniref:DUF4287 domain-containing protein n=1 Tax=Micromonospora sp. RTP1Z1 TaxID=2994043 RepID=UPI0039B68CED
MDDVRSSPLERHSVLLNWLKSEYGIGHATALVGHALPEDSRCLAHPVGSR